MGRHAGAGLAGIEEVALRGAGLGLIAREPLWKCLHRPQTLPAGMRCFDSVRHQPHFAQHDSVEFDYRIAGGDHALQALFTNFSDAEFMQ